MTLDPLLHSAPRITVMSRLAVHGALRFGELQKRTGLTPGNLATHLESLLAAGYLVDDVDETKVARKRTLRITPLGDAAFRSYIQEVRALLDQAEAGLDGNR